LFIVGLELNVNFMVVNARYSAIVAACSIIVPFLIGVGVSTLMYTYLQSDSTNHGNTPISFAFFIGTAMSITVRATVHFFPIYILG